MIDSVPNEILLRIFSNFEIHHLLVLDRVCYRWSRVIHEFIWSQLTNIDERAVDFPFGDCQRNLIEISQRVVAVKEIFSGLSLLPVQARRNETLKQNVMSAIVELLKKLSPDATLPLDIFEEVLSNQHPVDVNSLDQLPTMAEARQAVEKLSQAIHMKQFTSIQVNKVFVYGSCFRRDPFNILYKGRELALPLDFNRITQLIISHLVVYTMWADESGALSAARTLLSRISSFPKVDQIELEKITFAMPASFEEDDPPLEVTLLFHPHRCQFIIDDFLALLMTFADRNDDTRDGKMVSLVDEWLKKGFVECCDVAVHSVKFAEVIYLLKHREQDRVVPIDDSDCTILILDRVLSSLVTTMHLNIYHEYKNDEWLITLLQQQGVFSRLKEFSITFTDDIGDEDDDSYEEAVSWAAAEGVRRGRKIMRHLGQSMRNLEYVSLDFSMAGDYCLRAMSAPIEVAGPLPRLREFVHHGLVSFSFLVSVVKQAPNLQTLTVLCHNFEDEREGMEWIKKLLVALEGCRELYSLTIDVDSEEAPAPFDVKLRGRIRREKEEDCELLESVENQINRLVSILPRLKDVSVAVDTCGLDYTFCL